jgi:DNA-binding protein H-NS
MKRIELDGMSTDDLWSLHVEVSHLLQQENPSGKTAAGRASEAVRSPSVRAATVPVSTPEIPKS